MSLTVYPSYGDYIKKMSSFSGEWIHSLDGSQLPERKLIGGKAWSIAQLANLGLDVPPAFVISTQACKTYLQCGEFPLGLTEEIARAIVWLERQTGRIFGSGPNPLLVSVRSGSSVSMPGMMDTILNLGITKTTEAALAKEFGDLTFAKDTHRRFTELYTNIVLKNVIDDPVFSEAQVPFRVEDQLNRAVKAVFDSWNTRRAIRYRKHHDIPDDLGTAVTIQAMVFGNMNHLSGTGVLFTRNPLTGESGPYGEYLSRAQGEDIVSGRMSPQSLHRMKAMVPSAYDELVTAGEILEQQNGDVQDIEFTVQSGHLYFLQTRCAKRSPYAAARIAVSMAQEGRITTTEALRRITSQQVRSLLNPRLAEGSADSALTIATGVKASPGVGIGTVVSDPDEAELRALKGESIVLVRPTTSPDDLHGMISSCAIATEQGGTTSHAAVVSRALGRPCIVGCGAEKLMPLVGQKVTVDGTSGLIFAGELKVITPDEKKDEILCQLLEWARQHCLLEVSSVIPNGAKVIDLDRIDGFEDPEKFEEIIFGLQPTQGIKTSSIISDKDIATMVRAGITLIVTTPTLPIFLAIIHAGLNSEYKSQAVQS